MAQQSTSPPAERERPNQTNMDCAVANDLVEHSQVELVWTLRRSNEAPLTISSIYDGSRANSATTYRPDPGDLPSTRVGLAAGFDEANFRDSASAVTERGAPMPSRRGNLRLKAFH